MESKASKRDWLAIGTNLAVIGTALVSYLTLNQVKDQNAFAQRADVMLSLEQGSFESQLIASKQQTDFLVPDSVLNNLKFRLINIGLGPGKDLKVEWKTDFNKYQDSILLGKRWLVTNVRLNKNDGSLSIGNKLFYSINDSRFDFILPGNQEQKPLLEDLPADFFQVWNQCVGTLVLSAGDNLELLETMLGEFVQSYSKVPLTLEYTDLFQQSHKKTFYLSFAPYFINVGERKVAVRIDLMEEGVAAQPVVAQCVLFNPKDNAAKKINLRVE